MALEAVEESNLIDGIDQSTDPDVSIKLLVLLYVKRGTSTANVAEAYDLTEPSVDSLVETAERDGVDVAVRNVTLESAAGAAAGQGAVAGQAGAAAGQAGPGQPGQPGQPGKLGKADQATSTAQSAGSLASTGGSLVESIGRRGFMLLGGSALFGWTSKSVADGTSPASIGGDGGSSDDSGGDDSEDSGSGGDGEATNNVDELSIVSHRGEESTYSYQVHATIKNEGDQDTSLTDYTTLVTILDDSGNELDSSQNRYSSNSSEIRAGTEREFELDPLYTEPDKVDSYTIEISCGSGVYCE